MVVLIVDNDLREVQNLSSFLREHGHLPIATDSFKSAEGLAKRERPGLVLVNLNGHAAPVMEFIQLTQLIQPSPQVIVTTQRPRLEDAVTAMKMGAYDFWGKPLSKERLVKTIDLLDSPLQTSPKSAPPSCPDIITRDPSMLRLKAMALKVAASNATVFIQGESGTGKELIARFIHKNSTRKDRPFVALNCAALPETLMESELFGHEKGAFTGAIKTREGKFETANTGTLLLDEVTEIPLHLQAKLLRVLQESEVDRLGGRHPIRVDVRVLATTNLTMDEALKGGRFRKDLYYRLNVIPIKIPPLRDRPDDILLLSNHLIIHYNRLHGGCVKDISPEAWRKLQLHPWPGNVRELQNVIQRAVLLSTSESIAPEHLIFDEDGVSESPAQDREWTLMPLSEMEKRMIHKALDTVDGNRTRAAELLGISVRTLRNKLNEYRQQEEM